jgi:predicted Zn-dependent protease
MTSLESYSNGKTINYFSSIEWLTTQAVAKHKEGKLEEAIAFYLEVIELDNNQPAWVYGNTITLMAQVACLDEGLDLGEKALKIHPESDEIYRAISINQKFNGNLEQCINSYSKAIEIDSNQPLWVYLQLADVFIAKEALDDAIKAVKQGLLIYPEGEGLREKLEIAQSKQNIDESMLTEQDSIHFLHTQSVIEHKNNNFDTALKYYLEAINIDERQPDWLYENAIALLAQIGKPQKAIELSRKAIEIHKRSGNVFRAYGIALEHNNDLQESYLSFIKAIKLSRSQPEWVYYKVIEYLIEKNDIEDAIVIAKRGIEIYPKDSNLYYSLGESLELTNKWDEAIIAYKHCLKLDPSSRKTQTKLSYSQAQKQKAITKLLESTKNKNTIPIVTEDRKAISILLIANEAPPIKNFLTTAPGLRVYGLAEGLARHHYNVAIVAPINLRPIGEEKNYVFCNISNISVDYIEMKFISSYLINKSPDICIFTNYIQYSKLDKNIKQKIYQHTKKRTKFIYDLFAPKILEQISSEINSRSIIDTSINLKADALLTSDAFCINGEKKFGYILGWLASLNADLSKPIVLTNMCLPSSINNDEQAEQSFNSKPKFKFLLGGHKQSWNQSHISYIELISKIASKEWFIVNIGKPSFTGYSESPFAEKFVLEGKYLENHEILDYYQYKKLLKEEIDIAIDLFSLNRERQLAMVTRSIVSLSEGKPIIHPKGTEVSGFIEKYDAGWLYENESEIFGIIDYIASKPNIVRQKKINAKKLYLEQFDPLVAVGSLARLIQELLNENKNEDYRAIEEASIKISEKRVAFFQEKWYSYKHKLKNKIWDGEINNAYDYFIASSINDESTPNFLLDFIYSRKQFYQRFAEGYSLDNFKKLPNSVWLNLCGIWIDIPWYIKNNNLSHNPSEAIYHYFRKSNCLEVSPNRFFNEQWYRKYYEEVQAAIDLGFFINGFHHFLLIGIKKGYSPSPFFDNVFYLSCNAEIKIEAENSIYVNGFEHYMLSDNKDNAINYLTPIFNSQYYEDKYPSLRKNTEEEKKKKLLLYDFIDRGLGKNRYGSLFHEELFSEVKRIEIEKLTKKCSETLAKINSEWGYSNISMHFFEHLIKEKNTIHNKITTNNNWLRKIITYMEISL